MVKLNICSESTSIYDVIKKCQGDIIVKISEFGISVSRKDGKYIWQRWQELFDNRNTEVAQLEAQLDEKNREITRIAKNYAYCLVLLKNLVDRRLLSNEAMEAVNNFIKQSEGL